VECCGLESSTDGPIDRSLENGLIVLVHAEDEAGVDHDPKVVEAFDGLIVASMEIGVFVLSAQALFIECLESDEQAA
jgi:hypothetical protein